MRSGLSPRGERFDLNDVPNQLDYYRRFGPVYAVGLPGTIRVAGFVRFGWARPRRWSSLRRANSGMVSFCR